MVVIDVYNQQLSDAFDALRGKLTDMSPVLNAIGQCWRPVYVSALAR
jgi:uncharacterized protein (DUF2164 family)